MPKYPEFKSKPIIGLQEEDWNKLTVGAINRADANHAKTDYLLFKPELVAELAKPFVNTRQMMEFKGENEKQIRASGNLINANKMSRPEWFVDINDHKVRTEKIDFKARTEKTDYKARTAKIDYKNIAAKIDGKARAAKIDWEARNAKTNWKAISIKKYKPVNQYDLEGNFIKEWDSAKEASIAMGKPGKHDIGAVCRGKQKTAYGFIWKFKSEQN
jgi:hypothetical protein